VARKGFVMRCNAVYEVKLRSLMLILRVVKVEEGNRIFLSVSCQESE
jgi:hypothetical protein